MLTLNHEVIQVHDTFFLFQHVLLSALFKLAQSQGQLANVSVAPVGLRAEELDFDFLVNLIFAQVGRANLDLIPAERASFGAFDL